MDRQDLDDFLEDSKRAEMSASTIRAYRNQCSGFFDFLDRREITGRWSKVKPEHCQGWIDVGVSGSTKWQRYHALQLFFDWLKTHGKVRKNPLAALTPPENPRIPATFLSEKDVRSLIDAARAGDPGIIGTRDVAIVETLYSTGATSTELVGLNVGDVDLWSHVEISGSVRESRDAFLSTTARDALQAWLRQRTLHTGKPGDDSPLFIGLKSTKTIRRITARTVQSLVKDLGRTIGYEGVTSQVIRSSFARHMLDRGMHPDEVSVMLGNVSGGRGLQYIRRGKRLHTEHHPRP